MLHSKSIRPALFRAIPLIILHSALDDMNSEFFQKVAALTIPDSAAGRMTLLSFNELGRIYADYGTK